MFVVVIVPGILFEFIFYLTPAYCVCLYICLCCVVVLCCQWIFQFLYFLIIKNI